MRSTGSSGSAQKRSRNPMGNLPPGVKVYNVSNGNGGEFWRVRLNKKFTGGKVVTKNFQTVAECRDWIFGDDAKNVNGAAAEVKAVRVGQSELKKQLGAAAFGLTPGQLGEAQDAFKR